MRIYDCLSKSMMMTGRRIWVLVTFIISYTTAANTISKDIETHSADGFVTSQTSTLSLQVKNDFICMCK